MKVKDKIQKLYFHEQRMKFFHKFLWPLSTLMFTFIFFTSVPYLFYSVRFTLGSSSSNPLSQFISYTRFGSPICRDPTRVSTQFQKRTDLEHIVFGIAASSKLWEKRKNYIKLWWKPNQMNGVVWLDKPVKNDTVLDELLPPVKISADTSKFKYKNRNGHRSALRISRIVSETLRSINGTKIGENVRWFVMGDDDTVFFTENLVRVLRKYDHNQFYYIGSSSESHLQNIFFSSGMAYGGGGFAISYPLAKSLEKIQDRCIHRYPELYGSDDRIQACMAELGVPLTREPGFHQFDVYGKLFGLLTAHPIAPLVSLHHLDLVEPIFPKSNRVQSLNRLINLPAKLDSAALLQQSICYHRTNKWTVSVSWGYAVQIIRGYIPAREMEKPARTFLNWYPEEDYTAFSFNTRPVQANPCQRPVVYYLRNAVYDAGINGSFSEYVLDRVKVPKCKWKMPDPARVNRIRVQKKPDPNFWDKSPRRNCCRVLPTEKKGIMVIDVGECREDETVEF